MLPLKHGKVLYYKGGLLSSIIINAGIPVKETVHMRSLLDITRNLPLMI